MNKGDRAVTQDDRDDGGRESGTGTISTQSKGERTRSTDTPSSGAARVDPKGEGGFPRKAASVKKFWCERVELGV